MIIVQLMPLDLNVWKTVFMEVLGVSYLQYDTENTGQKFCCCWFCFVFKQNNIKIFEPLEI